MTNRPTTCRVCGAPLLATSRYCPQCGAAVSASDDTIEDIIVSSNKQLRVNGSMLSIPDLRSVVEASLSVWQSRLASADALNREQAAGAIKDLSRVLDSLSQQLAQGRHTVRITTRLPTPRSYPLGCPVCGYGNRAEARFCHQCGAALQAGGEPAQPATQPPPQPTIATASRTSVGQVRKNNEDMVLVGTIPVGRRSVLLCLVADGMGGAKAGEEASRIASETVQREVRAGLLNSEPKTVEEWQKLMRDSIIQANRAVYTTARASRDHQGMGTTMTAAVLEDRRVHIGHVGDTRAYLINPNGATAEGATWMPLTTDHTLVARLLDIGQLTPEQARTHPQRNILYRAVGTDPQVQVDSASFTIEPGDTVLICSDGMTTYLEDSELARIVLKNTNLTTACDQLIALANSRGGRDNISVVLAKVEG